MAGVAERSNELDVYYLSPRVLTRTNMTPERLQDVEFYVARKNLPVALLTRFLEKTRSTEHERTERSRFVYDFRLCVLSSGGSICVSGDGMVGYASKEPFLFSADEKALALNLFRELDTRASRAEKDK